MSARRPAVSERISCRPLLATAAIVALIVAFAFPIITTSTPASGDTVIDGCTIVSNPTPTNFTNCPGANLAGADLSDVNLSYANLAGAYFEVADQCFLTSLFPPNVECGSTSLSGANLTGADLSNASFFACASFGEPGPIFAVGCGSATLRGADLTGANLTNAGMVGCIGPFPHALLACGIPDMSGANLSGATLTVLDLEACPLGGPPCASPILSGADLTGTLFIPSNQTVEATSSAGALVTWTVPVILIGAGATSCTPPSGSTFPIGTTTVTCTVFDDFGNTATGTFTVTVQGAPEQLASLLVTVTNMGPGTSLAGKVQAAQAAVAAGLPAQAIADLNALIHEVHAQTGKKLTPTQAAAIVATATLVINELST